MKLVFSLLATLALTTTVLATSAQASHITVYIYSPYTNSNWYFTQGEHGGRLAASHDVSWDSTPSSIVFNATSGVTGEVTTVGINCNSNQPWDKYVTLSLFYGGEFYGSVSFVHITNPSVSVGQVVSPGTSLGSPQTQSSNCWGGVHVHMDRSSNGFWGGNDYICGMSCPPADQFSYATPMIGMRHSTIQRPELLRAPSQ